jgi:hypothetical protein
MDVKRQHIDIATALTLLVAAILFGVALGEKGSIHDFLLEAGVFLISVKLVLTAKSAELHQKNVEKKIDLLLERESSANPPSEREKIRLAKP